jgi:hypothetical protein
VPTGKLALMKWISISTLNPKTIRKMGSKAIAAVIGAPDEFEWVAMECGFCRSGRTWLISAGYLPTYPPHFCPREGTVLPEATVEARRYRLRILNACQAPPFLSLHLYVDDGSAAGGC